MLVIDDVGWGDVGYHKSNFPTPNIDALVKEGVELDRMYAMPQCSPTRAAIMTGRWAWTIGMQHFTTIMPGATAGIPQETPTVAEVLRDAGYDTHAIGKWHLGASSKSQTPVGRGFNSYLGYIQGETDYYDRTLPSCGEQICLFRGNCEGKMSGMACSKPMISPYGKQAAGFDFWDGITPSLKDMGKYTMHSYMARFEELLKPYNKTAVDKPLFVYFAQQLLHIPLQLPDAPHHLDACRDVTGDCNTQGVNRTVLCAMASQLDESIGRTVQMLKDYGLYDNTVIWVVSDNGGMTHWGDTFPASASSNFPLRGGKTTLFEGGVRVPAWVMGGGLPATAKGTKRKELLHAVDMFPTMAGLAGLTPSQLPKDLSGEDMWGTIIGAQDHVTKRTELPINVAINRDLNQFVPNRFARHASATNYSTLIQWPYKLIIGSSYLLPGGQKETVSRAGWWDIDDYKYTAPPAEELDAGDMLLFNIETDEGERHNVAKQFPEIVKKMTDRIAKWWLSKESGYRSPQWNVPWPTANPRYHNWTWAPFWHLEGEADAPVEAAEAFLV
jgi:arylsulfatase B/arylsulfatase I/J